MPHRAPRHHRPRPTTDPAEEATEDCSEEQAEPTWVRENQVLSGNLTVARSAGDVLVADSTITGTGASQHNGGAVTLDNSGFGGHLPGTRNTSTVSVTTTSVAGPNMLA